ncbi:hypothetical protein EHQ05_19210 [Leptospira yasudae]|uniref:hypothetical protein n=1 Tax=Leptospira yasudae TaxID=2202201 RepID=UPI0010844B8E|nr:hypothetical protein [Leptospira yasudae]TGK23322.1 hypothetical protein EHQ05_19210 [Leptospira yasudae]TGM09799.1 hypothetical protein EHQ86_00030 [Leptospira yasudae]
MKNKIYSVSKEAVFECFPNKGFIYKNPAPIPDVEESEAKIRDLLQISNASKASIVCIDAYKYSKNDLQRIFLIPLVIQSLHDMTLSILKENELFLFKDIDEPLVSDTGDGAICVFPTPLHAILYILWYEVALQLYNTYHISPGIREIVGKLSVRYSTSYDEIIKIGNNYYGPAIISAARMISSDRLNRCLIDEYSVDWFTRYFNGIENLIMISKMEVRKIMEFIYPNDDFSQDGNLFSIFFRSPDKHWGIKTCNLQHIGEMKIKDAQISVYNLHILVLAGLLIRPDHEKEDEEVKLSVSIGNTNPMGLGGNYA